MNMFGPTYSERAELIRMKRDIRDLKVQFEMEKSRKYWETRNSKGWAR